MTFLLRSAHRLNYFASSRLTAWTKSNMSTEATGPVQQKIHEKLTKTFSPTHIEIFNESYMHSVPKGSETHFKVVVVSDSFDGLTPIKRHRSVNAALKEELESGVHALSITAKTPKQWEVNDTVSKSPACRGGAGL